MTRETVVQLVWEPVIGQTDLLRLAALTVVCGILLIAVFLTQIASPPVTIEGWQVATLVVAGSLVAIGIDITTRVEDPPLDSIIITALTGIVLLERLGRYRDPHVLAGEFTVLEPLFVLLILFAFAISYPDPRSIPRRQWPFIGAFAVVATMFIAHLYTLPSDSLVPMWPIWAVITAGVVLLVIPRVIPELVFLWTLAVLAAGIALIAIASAVIGEFTLVGVEVGVSRKTVPLIGSDVVGWSAHAAIFNNPNVLGLVAFAGLAASTISAYRAQTIRVRTIASGLIVLTGVGLVLSSSGVAWVAATVTIGTYTAYATFGRRAVLPTIILGAFATVVLLANVAAGALPLDDSGRLIRWRASIEAFQADPAIVGHGHISTAHFIEPYLEGRAPSTPHNSYLSILLRFGVIGLIAYAVLVIGVIIERAYNYQTANIGMLAFALGWATHHLFESYTLVQWTIPAVLSALVVGYLIVDVSAPEYS